MNKTAKLLRKIIYTVTLYLNKVAFNMNNQIVVLSYHDISNRNWEYSVKPINFKKQINYLINNGYKFVDIKEFTQLIKQSEYSGKYVLLTFDDGYESIFEIRKFLQKHKIKPLLFLLAGTRVNRKELSNSVPLLTTNQVKELLNIGWDLGSHSMTHANFNELSQHDLNYEILKSKQRLEKLYARRINYFSYPKGKYSQEIIKLIKKAKYTHAFSMDDEILGNKNITNYAIGRVGIVNSHSMIEFKATVLPLTILLRKYIKKII